jgi:tetratricopeptide (TPR) repeat protein
VAGAEEYAGLIAEHHRQAGDDTTAARWYLRAGRKAARVYANPEALALYAHALDLAGTDERELRFDVLLAREEVYDRVGDRAAQRSDLDAMAALLDGVDDARRAVEMRVALARWHFEHSEYTRAAATAHEGALVAAEAGVTHLEAEAMLWMGKSLTWAFDHDAARETLGVALDLARRSADRRIEGETLRYLAIVANNLSELGEAVRLLHHARAIHRDAGDLESESLALGQLGAVYFNQGRYEDARVTLEQARDIISQSGHRYRLAVMVSNLAAIALEQGRYGMARREGETGLDLQIELGDKEGVGNSHQLLADVARHVGDDARAEHHAQQVLAVRGERGFQVLASAVSATRTLIAARNGDAPAAEAHARHALEQARRAGRRSTSARAHVALGDRPLQAGDPHAAEASFEEAGRTRDSPRPPRRRAGGAHGLCCGAARTGQGAGGAQPDLADRRPAGHHRGRGMPRADTRLRHVHPRARRSRRPPRRGGASPRPSPSGRVGPTDRGPRPGGGIPPPRRGQRGARRTRRLGGRVTSRSA